MKLHCYIEEMRRQTAVSVIRLKTVNSTTRNIVIAEIKEVDTTWTDGQLPFGREGKRVAAFDRQRKECFRSMQILRWFKLSLHEEDWLAVVHKTREQSMSWENDSQWSPTFVRLSSTGTRIVACLFLFHIHYGALHAILVTRVFWNLEVNQNYVAFFWHHWDLFFPSVCISGNNKSRSCKRTASFK